MPTADRGPADLAAREKCLPIADLNPEVVCPCHLLDTSFLVC